jgi:hypothetical protein
VAYHPEALIVATKRRPRAGVLPIPRRAAAPSIHSTHLLEANPATTTVKFSSYQSEPPILKYLVIGAVLALLFIFIYSRLEPYIAILRKVFGVLRGTLDSAGPSSRKAGSIKTENKLVRCVVCGTWIPAERAIGSGTKLSAYCSRECMEKSAGGKERKLAG